MNAIEDICTIMKNDTDQQDASTCYDDGETRNATNQKASGYEDANSTTIWFDGGTEEAYM